MTLGILGDSFDEWLENLEKVLKRCIEKNVLKLEKCHFMVTQGIVLADIVSSEGMQVNKAKIDIISNLPPPKNLKDIQSFLGHKGFTGVSLGTLARSRTLCANYLLKIFHLSGPNNARRHLISLRSYSLLHRLSNHPIGIFILNSCTMQVTRL